jgi:hypothetical protein
MADFVSGGRNYYSYTASYNGNKGFFWETLVDLIETSNLGDILCTLGFRGTTIAVVRHKFDRINTTLLGDLADNAVVEIHCFSHGIDGAADDNRPSTDAVFRRSINCGKGLCSMHRLRVLVSHRGSLSLNSGSEVTSETAIQLLRTAHNESNSDRTKLIMEYLRFMPIPFADVPYVLHNASNLSLFLSPPNGLYASITNDSPTSMFKIQWGIKNECLVFKGNQSCTT